MKDEDSHEGAQDDCVFDDNNLTWGDVARATRAEESRFDTRARARAKASSSIIPPTRGIASSSRTLPSHSLIDEDEDGDMVDSTDEEDREGYKCGDGNYDDDDFVDLEEEWWLFVVDKFHVLDLLVWKLWIWICIRLLAIWIWICFYTWSSLFLCFLLIKLKFWMIFDNLCV